MDVCVCQKINSNRMVKCARLILRTRGLPRVSLWRCKNIRTRRDLEWFGPTEPNTLHPL